MFCDVLAGMFEQYWSLNVHEDYVGWARRPALATGTLQYTSVTTIDEQLYLA